MKKWTTAPDFIGDKSEIKREFGDLLGELLLRRGITDTEKAFSPARTCPTPPISRIWKRLRR